jgi:acetyltransferase EpsM
MSGAPAAARLSRGIVDARSSIYAKELAMPSHPPSSREVAVIGAGDHGRVVAAAIEAAGSSVSGHYDDDPATWGTSIGASRVIGPPRQLAPGTAAVIAVGDNRRRKHLAEHLPLEWVTVVHPFSWLHPDVQLGPGTVVCAGVVAEVGARVGAHVILNNRASVGHDTTVGDYTLLTVCHLGGGGSLGEGGLLGIGSVVLPRVTVGAWATVGAGAVVLTDVRPGATVVGSPAHEIRHERPISAPAYAAR